MLSNIEELNDTLMPTYTLSEWPTLYDSSDMGATQWNQIAKDIAEKYNDVSGFVILCGTDTMAYAASALSFMLKNTDKPVVFTGSSIPFGEVHSDARRNLIVSIAIAGFVDIPEVMIFFNEALFRGNRTRKKDSGGMDAFHSPKFPPLATLGVGLHINEHLVHAPPLYRFETREVVDVKAAFVRVMPGYNIDWIGKMLNANAHKNLQAVVLELVHSNPIQYISPDFTMLLRRLVDANLTVILSSQCPVGRLSAEYSDREMKLREQGVIFGGDMTAEAIATKLAYAYGRKLAVPEIRSLMESNIRGELTEIRREEEKTVDT